MFPISRIEAEKYKRLALPIEIAGKKINVHGDEIRDIQRSPSDGY
jgi:hypothetical protein